MVRAKVYKERRAHILEANPGFFNALRTHEDVNLEYKRLRALAIQRENEAIEAARIKAEEEKLEMEKAEKRAVREKARKEKEAALKAVHGQASADTIAAGGDFVDGRPAEDWTTNTGDFVDTAATANNAEWGVSAGDWDDADKPIDDVAHVKGPAGVSDFDTGLNESAEAWEEVAGGAKPVDTTLPTEGFGDWNVVEKKKKKTRRGKKKTAGGPGSGCFNCGGAHRKVDCTEPKQPHGACRKCGQEGHFAKDCPEGGAGGTGGGACHKCGEEGHFARDCPQGGGGGTGGGACHKCGEEGHFARDCPTGANLKGACRKCGEEGHFARECPTAGGGEGRGRGCHICGSEDHMVRDCTKGRACFNCGQTGHMSRECPEPKQSNRRTGGGGTCYTCGQPGHKSNQCPTKNGAAEGGSNVHSGFDSGFGDLAQDDFGSDFNDVGPGNGFDDAGATDFNEAAVGQDTTSDGDQGQGFAW